MNSLKVVTYAATCPFLPIAKFLLFRITLVVPNIALTLLLLIYLRLFSKFIVSVTPNFLKYFWENMIGWCNKCWFSNYSKFNLKNDKWHIFLWIGLTSSKKNKCVNTYFWQSQTWMNVIISCHIHTIFIKIAFLHAKLLILTSDNITTKPCITVLQPDVAHQ